MPRLRAAGYKYAALPDVAGQKSAEEREREQLEQTWKQKTADLWANAELEVPQAQARRLQQRERKANRALTVPLPPRAGATSPTRERRKVTTASPSRGAREEGAARAQLEDRTNRAVRQQAATAPPPAGKAAAARKKKAARVAKKKKK
jgi:hypothetical protein